MKVQYDEIVIFQESHILPYALVTIKEAPPKQQVKALFEFSGTRRGDLPFKVGGIMLISLDSLNLIQLDIITVLGKEGDNWWEGELSNGAKGSFPTNYVEVCLHYSTYNNFVYSFC